MRTTARRTKRGQGLWLALVAVLALLVALGALATNGRVHESSRTVRRAICESVFEEIALSAANEAFCRCLAKANDPVGSPSWYQAFHEECTTARVLGTVAASLASDLAGPLDRQGLSARLDPVTVTLASCGPDANGLVTGWLQMDVRVSEDGGELERNLRARRVFYLRGNLPGGGPEDPEAPDTRPVTVAPVVGGRARQNMWGGQ